MKKVRIIGIVFALLSALCIMAACNGEIDDKPVSVTGVTLSHTAESLMTGAQLQLAATVAPADAADKSVTWSTSNESRASVDANGLVTAISAGTVFITVSTTDGDYSATCSITVTAPIAAESVALSKDALALYVGDEETIETTVLPADATNKAVSWSSGNEDVATVSPIGVVVAVGAGTAVITVTTADGSHTDTCTVTVTAIAVTAIEITAPPTKTSYVAGEFFAPAGMKVTLTYNRGEPRVIDGDYGELTFTPALATALTTTDISVTVTLTGTALSDTQAISVTPAPIGVTGVLLSASTLSPTMGQSAAVTLTATIQPAGATNGAVSWASDNESAVTVGGTGSTVTLNLIGAGTAVITVTTADGGYTATCTVTVAAEAVTGIDITTAPTKVNYVSGTFFAPAGMKVTVTYNHGGTRVIDGNYDELTFTPALTTELTTSDTSVTVTLTGTACSDTQAISVSPAAVGVTGVELSAPGLSLTVGQTEVTLSATVLPAGATNNAVSWVSDNESAVTISGTGLTVTLNPIAAGTAVITVTTTDGSYTATCTVTVTDNAVVQDAAGFYAALANTGINAITIDAADGLTLTEGLVINRNLTVNGILQLQAIPEDVNGLHMRIAAGCTLTVNGKISSTVIATDDLSLGGEGALIVYCPDNTVVEAIKGRNINITGIKLVVADVSDVSDGTYALAAEGTLTIAEADVKVYATLWAQNAITITNSTVLVDNRNLHDVLKEKSSGVGKAIDSHAGTLSITGSDVTVYDYIYSNKAMTVVDSTLVVDNRGMFGDKHENSRGIWSDGALTITNSEVTMYSNIYGKGIVTIDGGTDLTVYGISQTTTGAIHGQGHYGAGIYADGTNTTGKVRIMGAATVVRVYNVSVNTLEGEMCGKTAVESKGTIEVWEATLIIGKFGGDNVGYYHYGFWGGDYVHIDNGAQVTANVEKYGAGVGSKDKNLYIENANAAEIPTKLILNTVLTGAEGASVVDSGTTLTVRNDAVSEPHYGALAPEIED